MHRAHRQGSASYWLLYVECGSLKRSSCRCPRQAFRVLFLLLLLSITARYIFFHSCIALSTFVEPSTLPSIPSCFPKRGFRGSTNVLRLVWLELLCFLWVDVTLFSRPLLLGIKNTAYMILPIRHKSVPVLLHKWRGAKSFHN